MSRPLTPASDMARSSKWTRTDPPGVNDVRNKVCWICREEEATEAANGRRAWIHPCDCTLVAHESCLLTWVRMQAASQDGGSSEGLKCPQCKTPFELRSQEPPALRMLDRINNGVTRVARWSSLTVIAGSVLGLSTIYGSFAMRCFVGNEMADIVLGGRHPGEWHLVTWVNLPLVPFALILKRYGWLPTAAPFFIAPISTFIQHQYFRALLTPTYPPTPPVLGLLWPLINNLYRRAWKAIILRLVPVRRSGRRSPQNREGIARVRRAARQGVDGERVVGAVGGGVVVDALVDELGDQVVDELDGDFRAALERGETITLTGGTLSRVFIGSLILPPIAYLTGEVLRRISLHSTLMRTFLGIRPTPVITIPTGWREQAATVYRIVTEGARHVSPRIWSYNDFDPIWWRNAIGLSIFIVTRDTIDVWRRYLRIREKRSREVISKPFTNVDYSELDLIV